MNSQSLALALALTEANSTLFFPPPNMRVQLCLVLVAPLLLVTAMERRNDYPTYGIGSPPPPPPPKKNWPDHNLDDDDGEHSRPHGTRSAAATFAVPAPTAPTAPTATTLGSAVVVQPVSPVPRFFSADVWRHVMTTLPHPEFLALRKSSPFHAHLGRESALAGRAYLRAFGPERALLEAYRRAPPLAVGGVAPIATAATPVATAAGTSAGTTATTTAGTTTSQDGKRRQQRIDEWRETLRYLVERGPVHLQLYPTLLAAVQNRDTDTVLLLLPDGDGPTTAAASSRSSSSGSGGGSGSGGSGSGSGGNGNGNGNGDDNDDDDDMESGHDHSIVARRFRQQRAQFPDRGGWLLQAAVQRQSVKLLERLLRAGMSDPTMVALQSAIATGQWFFVWMLLNNNNNNNINNNAASRATPDTIATAPGTTYPEAIVRLLHQAIGERNMPVLVFLSQNAHLLRPMPPVRPLLPPLQQQLQPLQQQPPPSPPPPQPWTVVSLAAQLVSEAIVQGRLSVIPWLMGGQPEQFTLFYRRFALLATRNGRLDCLKEIFGWEQLYVLADVHGDGGGGGSGDDNGAGGEAAAAAAAAAAAVVAELLVIDKHDLLEEAILAPDVDIVRYLLVEQAVDPWLSSSLQPWPPNRYRFVRAARSLARRALPSSLLILEMLEECDGSPVRSRSRSSLPPPPLMLPPSAAAVQPTARTLFL